MPFDLTGTWRGHYEQMRGRHGISMTVAQRGASFVGRMRDADTLLATTEKLETPAPALFGNATEIEIVHSLPEQSHIEGSVEGSVVQFVKRYLGKTTSSVWACGASSVHQEKAGHCVHYRGELDASGDLLCGEWRIVSTEEQYPDLVDRFELRRER